MMDGSERRFELFCCFAVLHWHAYTFVTHHLVRLAHSTVSHSFFSHPSPCASSNLSSTNMTAIVDHIDFATDRIREDELLANQKRLTYSFPPSTTLLSVVLTHNATQLENFKLGGSLSCFLKQETCSLPFPFPQRLNNCLPLTLAFVFKLHLISCTARAHPTNRKAQLPPPALLLCVHPPQVGVCHGRHPSGPFHSQQRGQHEPLRQGLYSPPSSLGSRGQPSPDGCLPVEKPELSTPGIERRMSELCMITSIFHPFRSLADPRPSEL
jgi:hypothetical protein